MPSLSKGGGFRDRQVFAQLQEYITQVVCTDQGGAASSAAGEVICWRGSELHLLQSITEQPVDCLAFSADGQYLAAGCQDGRVRVWHDLDLVITIEADQWIEHLSWHSSRPELAFSSGHYVQVWDVAQDQVITTLDFVESSVLDLAWHPVGDRLAIAGYQGVKIWQDWDDDPHVLALPTSTQAIAWSPDGKYLALGNFDNTLVVMEWGNPDPWIMRGFPGKVRALTWSQIIKPATAPLIGCASAEGVVIWAKDKDGGWAGHLLEGHIEKVNAIAFQPASLRLASASDDGQICLWQKAKKLEQILPASPEAVTSLAWHKDYLLAGTSGGEVIKWSKSTQGFG